MTDCNKWRLADLGKPCDFSFLLQEFLIAWPGCIRPHAVPRLNGTVHLILTSVCGRKEMWRIGIRSRHAATSSNTICTAQHSTAPEGLSDYKEGFTNVGDPRRAIGIIGENSEI